MKRLSNQEKNVLDLLKEGYRNTKIADVLGIKRGDVAQYIMRIRVKIGLEGVPVEECNAYKIVKRAIKLGLLND